MRRVLSFILACALTSACGPKAPQQPMFKCRAGSTDKSVMLVEWSNLERANLERLLAGGAIAVAYHGCEMEVVPCQLAGQYGWQRASSSSQEDLQLSTDLTLTAVVAGHARLTGMEAVQVPAFCQNATHLVDAISVGAFSLARAGSKADAPREIVRAVGDRPACSGATDEGPAAGCNATIEVSLVEIPGRLGNRPVGSVRTELVSGVQNKRWDIYVDDKAVCTTPCSRWIDPKSTIAMRMRDSETKMELVVPGIPADKGPLQITAKPPETREDTGFMLAFGGGFVALFGVMLGIAAASKQEAGYLYGSLAMLALGIPGLIIGVQWMREKPESMIVPLYDRGHVRAVVSPLGITGTF